MSQSSVWQRRFRWFLAISLLLHLFLFFGYGAYSHFHFLPDVAEKTPDEDRIVFEVVESPEKETEPPKKARLFSYKNTRAANPTKTEDRGDLPFQVGDIPEPVTPQPPTVASRPENQPVPKTDKGKETDEKTEELTKPSRLAYIPPAKGSFSRDVLLGRRSSPPARTRPPQPATDNRKFSVDDLGGFAFNTYDWNFAPYLLYLKKRIQKNIFPPPAFTRMGIIEGRSVLRFVISKEGKLIGLKVLAMEGHQSLVETSVLAVEVSAPFRPLPSDFPEKALEVTGTFIYKVYR